MDSDNAKNLVKQHEMAEKHKKEEERKHRLNLIAMLTPEARERLDRLALVNPTKAAQVGDMIVGHCESGYVSHRVTDDEMKDYMETVGAKTQKSGTVTIQRKRYGDSDDDDDNDDDL